MQYALDGNPLDVASFNVYDRAMPGVKKHIFITEGQDDFLEGLDGLSLSEHIRRAIDDYIVKKRKGLASPSSSKRGGFKHVE